MAPQSHTGPFKFPIEIVGNLGPQKGKMNILNKFPEDMIREIFSRLPLKTLIRLTCVCKAWRNFILSDYTLAYSHLQRTIENNNRLENVLMYSVRHSDMQRFCNPEAEARRLEDTNFSNPLYLGKGLTLAGCCNGIICMYIPNGRIYMWNPALRQCRILPSNKEVHQIYPHDHVAFGYDSVNQDYKVLKLYGGFQEKASMVELYSLKNNSWKWVCFDLPASYRYYLDICTLDFNGCLHWISNFGPQADMVRRHSIIAFDVAQERFLEFMIPEIVPSEKFCGLGVSEGRILLVSGLNSEYRFEVWRMEYYGVPESWARVFVIRHSFPPFGYYRPVGVTMNGELLMRRMYDVVLYDLEMKHSRILLSVGSDCKYFVSDYVESLISVMPHWHNSKLQVIDSCDRKRGKEECNREENASNIKKTNSSRIMSYSKRLLRFIMK